MRPDTQAYFRSLVAELDAQATRVRCLIGETHWLSDGNHKEALLRGLFERHLPAATLACRGFVVEGAKVSKEQDILIVDTYPEGPPFFQNNLVIAPPERVLASISVKTTWKKGEVVDAIRGLDSLPRSSNPPWRGVYFFNSGVPEADLTKLARTVQRWTEPIGTSTTISIRASSDHYVEITEQEVVVHRHEGFATAFFLAGVLNFIASHRGRAASLFADMLDSCSGETESARCAR